MHKARWSRLAVVAMAVGGLVLAGCGDDDDDSDGGDDGSQIANPATVFCEEQGGTPEIVTAADGSQSGVCVLADGTRIDEWEYYYQQTGQTTTTG